MRTKATETIKHLTRTDFYEMLLGLEMLIGPEPPQRDKQDAQAFLDIFLPAKSSPIEGQSADANETQ